MREIKFRAWCKNKNEWETDRIAIQPDGSILHMSTTKNMPCMVKAETHDIQMFTGLLDKNGTEIYEGDVVSATPKPNACGVVSSVNGQSCFERVVIWLDNDARFSWQLLDGTINASGYTLCKNNEDLFEVIGNIHVTQNF